MFRSIVTSALRAPTFSRLGSASIMGGNNITAMRFFSEGVKSGTVKWFDSKKGFGFIIPDDGSEDIFVHQSSIHAEGFRSLADGESVEFTVFEDTNGRTKAENVTGPMGAYVQGAPRRPRMYTDNNFGGESYGRREGGERDGGSRGFRGGRNDGGDSGFSM